MNKKSLLLILALLAAFAVGYFLMEYNRGHKATGDLPSDFTIEAAGIFSEFDADEKAAGTKFNDKVIEVTGKIVSVETGKDGIVKVTLDGGGMLGGVICQLDPRSADKATDLKKGDMATFKGICTGYLMDVILVRCDLVK